MSNKGLFWGIPILILALASCRKDKAEHMTSRIPIMATTSSAETKGKIITTAGINRTDSAFAIHAYLGAAIASTTTEDKYVDAADKANYHFIGDTIAGEPLEYTGNGTTHSWDWSAAVTSGSDDDRPKWRGDLPIRFWSYYPAEVFNDLTVKWPHTSPTTTGKPTDAEQKVVSFAYTLPTNVLKQRDLLLAFNEEKREFEHDDEGKPTDIDGNNGGNYGTNKHSGTGIYDEYIDIHFYHALAAVNFDLGGVPANAKVTEISINNVKYSGTCTATGTATGNIVGFEWTSLSSDTKSFTQAFEQADFTALGTDPETYGRQLASSEKTFFMIPQTLTDTTKLTVAFDFKEGGVPIRREVAIGKEGAVSPATHVTWEAGKIYTYEIKVTTGFTLLAATLSVRDWVDGKMDTSF